MYMAATKNIDIFALEDIKNGKANLSGFSICDDTSFLNLYSGLIVKFNVPHVLNLHTEDYKKSQTYKNTIRSNFDITMSKTNRSFERSVGAGSIGVLLGAEDWFSVLFHKKTGCIANVIQLVVIKFLVDGNILSWKVECDPEFKSATMKFNFDDG